MGTPHSSPSPPLFLTGVDDRGNKVSRRARTKADGTYRFEGLRPGTYAVRVAEPEGYLPQEAKIGSEGGRREDARSILEIPLQSGSDGTTYNFQMEAGKVGASVEGRVRGRAWSGGVRVLLTGVDREGEEVRREAWTAADGGYRFTDLPAGRYVVSPDLPGTQAVSGKVDGEPQDSAMDAVTFVELGAGAAGDGFDFCE
jgi:hypothetical protein